MYITVLPLTWKQLGNNGCAQQTHSQQQQAEQQISTSSSSTSSSSAASSTKQHQAVFRRASIHLAKVSSASARTAQHSHLSLLSVFFCLGAIPDTRTGAHVLVQQAVRQTTLIYEIERVLVLSVIGYEYSTQSTSEQSATRRKIRGRIYPPTAFFFSFFSPRDRRDTYHSLV